MKSPASLLDQNATADARATAGAPAVWSIAAMLEFSHDAIIGQSLDGVVTTWNPAAEKTFGYPAAEMVGKPLSRIVPLDRRAGENSRAAAAQRGERVANVETIYRHRSGKIVPVSVTIFPLRDFAGQVAGSALLARDLSAERRSEARAQAAEQNHRLVFQNNPVPMWVHDVDTLRFLAANDAALHAYGYGRDEFLQLAVTDLVPSELGAEIRVQLEEFESICPGVSTHRRNDGSLLHVELAAREVTLDERAGRLVTVRDVTARLHAEAATRRVNAQLDQALRERTAHFERAVTELEAFSYSVSHDLRAPLRCIHGFARTLFEEHATQLDDEGRRLLGVIRQEAQHMSQLIDDILAFSRVGRQALVPGGINMTDLAEGTCQEFLELTEKTLHRPIALQITSLPPANGDRAMVRLVLTNLFANAVKFTGRHPAPKIEIRGRQEGAQCFYSIRDNGVGFDSRYAHKLFNVFQRLHSQDEFEGTGVGLAIVQRIIQRHGGKVWAESEVDHGAVFHFTLPAATREGTP